MPSFNKLTPAVLSRLLDPAFLASQRASRSYRCSELSDMDFLEMGVIRCISDAQTGRGFLQLHGDHGRKDIPVDLFFKALKSRRRLENLISINQLLAPAMTARCVDPYAEQKELANFDLIAGDGHFHAAACHDARCISGKKLATGHFFLVNLRTHHMRQLTLARKYELSRGNEHDMRALKRTDLDELRGGAPKGRKVLIVWDRAGIDFPFWQKCKDQSGVYYISREKENMALEVLGNIKFDKDDVRNEGVLRDEYVGPGGGGYMLRRVTYQTPQGEIYSFLTTEMKLPPGLIALLYKQRWDIEKIFDEFKNKLMEKKSWASSEVAKTMHATFLCLAHNLMVMLEAELEKEEGISNEAEGVRKTEVLKKAKQRLKDAGLKLNFVATALHRFTVRSIKFVRWLRNFIYRDTSWPVATARLRKIYATT
jgi:hypothetical protein